MAGHVLPGDHGFLHRVRDRDGVRHERREGAARAVHDLPDITDVQRDSILLPAREQRGESTTTCKNFAMTFKKLACGSIPTTSGIREAVQSCGPRERRSYGRRRHIAAAHRHRAYPPKPPSTAVFVCHTAVCASTLCTNDERSMFHIQGHNLANSPLAVSPSSFQVLDLSHLSL